MKANKTYPLREAQIALEYYCSYQERSHKEVAQKLNKMGLIPQAIERITTSLLQNDFLNEERFAKSFARGKFRINKWGKIKIKQHLHQKGVSKANINIGLQEINEEEYLQTLHDLAKKKSNLLKENNVYKKKQKLIQYLYQKGFETTLISELVLN